MNSPCIVVPLVEILKRCLQYNVRLCLGPLGVCKMDSANLLELLILTVLNVGLFQFVFSVLGNISLNSKRKDINGYLDTLSAVTHNISVL